MNGCAPFTRGEDMNMNILWAGILCLAIGLATNRALVAADKATDFGAEQKQTEKEDAEQQAEREKGIRGKYQRVFFGTVYLLTEANPELSPAVVGNFVTNDRDRKPGRNYLMKLAADNKKALVDALMRVNGKTARITGLLRVIDANGEAKYLIVDSVSVEGPTPTVPERRSASGL
jgi:hypothetical protein